ncbi:MAG: superoxide dismutase [Microcystaceae cyanobacterium]
MIVSRRHLLQGLSFTTSAAVFGVSSSFNRLALADNSPYNVIPLPYDFKALEPYIDGKTMEFHYGKHYVGYTRNLNKAVNSYPELRNQSAEALLSNFEDLPRQIKTTVRNNGGGYVNHTMFWQIMSPNSSRKPIGEIGQEIRATFSSFEDFKEAFNQAGSSQFGSGWAWLVLDKNKKLQIISTPNQDSPLMQGLYPVMGNDVWEHAYYLKYKNNRGEYLKQWWNVVNWEEVNKRYLKGKI